MIEALIAGQRNPAALADLAIGKMRAKRKELTEALDGRFEDHHAELARILLDQIDALTSQVTALDERISELIAQIPAAQGTGADGTTGPGAGRGPDAAVLPAVARLDEITGCRITAAQAIIAEIGLDMTVFGTPGRLVSWAERCPQTRQSGKKHTAGKARKGQPLAQRRPRRDRRLRLPHRYLPRRALPPPRPQARETQIPGRHRPLHPRHHQLPARRPRHPVPRPWPRLLRQPHQPRPQNQQPRPPAGSPRPHRHHRRSRLTPAPQAQALPAPPAQGPSTMPAEVPHFR
jgi:hypothetical protein